MMKNRVDKLVLKAFLELELPKALAEDEALAARCYTELQALANRLLMGRDERIALNKPPIEREDKLAINNMIARLPESEEKRALVFFYRLAVLVETILLKYRLQFTKQ